MDISIRTRILYKLYGAEYIEAYRLDSILEVFTDEKIRDISTVTEQPQGHERVFDNLIRDGYLKQSGTCYEITSEGLLFYGQGGYTNQFLLSKRANWSFIISVISAIIAIASFFISICH